MDDPVSFVVTLITVNAVIKANQEEGKSEGRTGNVAKPSISPRPNWLRRLLNWCKE